MLDKKNTSYFVYCELQDSTLGADGQTDLHYCASMEEADVLIAAAESSGVPPCHM